MKDMINREQLVEMYIKLNEEFRDYDNEINELENELYDLIYSVEETDDDILGVKDERVEEDMSRIVDPRDMMI